MLMYDVCMMYVCMMYVCMMYDDVWCMMYDVWCMYVYSMMYVCMYVVWCMYVWCVHLTPTTDNWQRQTKTKTSGLSLGLGLESRPCDKIVPTFPRPLLVFTARKGFRSYCWYSAAHCTKDVKTILKTNIVIRIMSVKRDGWGTQQDLERLRDNIIPVLYCKYI